MCMSSMCLKKKNNCSILGPIFFYIIPATDDRFVLFIQYLPELLQITLGIDLFPNSLRSNSPGNKTSSDKSPKSAYSGTIFSYVLGMNRQQWYAYEGRTNRMWGKFWGGIYIITFMIVGMTYLRFGELFQLWIIVSLKFYYCLEPLIWEFIEMILPDISKILIWFKKLCAVSQLLSYKSLTLFRGRNASLWISVILFFSKSL